MFLDTTEIDINNDQLINDVVGRSFTFFQLIKVGSTDSKIMIIDEMSDYLKSLLDHSIINTYATIELRPKGILVRLHNKLKKITWVILYSQLRINLENGVTIRKGDHFLKFKKNKSLLYNKLFFKRLQRLKIKPNVSRFVFASIITSVAYYN